jgi:hypothetical protein
VASLERDNFVVFKNTGNTWEQITMNNSSIHDQISNPI